MKKRKITSGIINNLVGVDANGAMVYQSPSDVISKAVTTGDLNLVVDVGGYIVSPEVINKPAGSDTYIYLRVTRMGGHVMQEAWNYFTGSYIGYRTKGYPSITVWNAWRKS